MTRRSLIGASVLGAGGAAVSAAPIKAAVRGAKSHVAIVGAGVFGAWTAHHLQKQGHRVTLIVGVA